MLKRDEKTFLSLSKSRKRRKKVKEIEGLTVEFLPPYSPELYAKRYPLGQPAERLWTLVDEPLVNQSFETQGYAPRASLDATACYRRLQ